MNVIVELMRIWRANLTELLIILSILAIMAMMTIGIGAFLMIAMFKALLKDPIEHIKE